MSLCVCTPMGNSIFFTLYVVSVRLSATLPILPFIISMTLVFPSQHLFGFYHIFSLIYLLLDGIHQMLLSYRTVSYDRLITDPWIVERMVPDTIIFTDKKFNPHHVLWAFLLGLSKGCISFMQARYFANTVLSQIIFWAALALAGLVVLSESMMACLIRLEMEAKFMSQVVGIEVENTQQTHAQCQYIFKVADTTPLLDT